jgi:hypothetical protein
LQAARSPTAPMTTQVRISRFIYHAGTSGLSHSVWAVGKNAVHWKVRGAISVAASCALDC